MAGAASTLEASWQARLQAEFDQPYMLALRQFLQEESAAGAPIYPPCDSVFNAFAHTPLPQVKVVILGQDPYHGYGQAHGLAFSVLPGTPIPPSLQNIFKELQRDLGVGPPGHGCLQAWADRGVLLLNSVLTVRGGAAASHRGKGWEQFTDRVIDAINCEREGVVFMLWGGYAQRKGGRIDANRHVVLCAPHPSPLSAHRGFIGCGHFGAANDYLASRGQAPIDWRLPPAS
ncbi:uracil-DNA glycosylase [Kineobactrum sediminis]|uniref:Uracil-DNA glycosylase n=1 Tax=Kineobactrum sediminis TaxID=1905677 RepID=A0A2N5Y451_9GAMM|nr:uracil-DNA glycosylase [Kineobactrum sediminis]PLW83148.1 uracil-DNA glycosylase [Kineobactrum sediminis]